MKSKKKEIWQIWHSEFFKKKKKKKKKRKYMSEIY